MILTRICIIIALSFFAVSVFGQLKVDSYGRIGMGTEWPSSGYKCHIKGDLLLTTYPDIPSIEFQFKIGDVSNGSRIGSATDRINFYTPWTDYNKIYAQQLFLLSDESIKSNISDITNPIDKIFSLKPYSYNMLDRKITAQGDSVEGYIRNYGFLSQEVEEALSEVKITEEGIGYKMLDYVQIIPLLVAGTKQQQEQINLLQSLLTQLITDLNSQGANFKSGNEENDTNSANNKDRFISIAPNPFNSITTITYILNTDNINSAEIRVWHTQGSQIRTYSLPKMMGQAAVNLVGADLPSSGVYVLMLWINGELADSKSIVFTAE